MKCQKPLQPGARFYSYCGATQERLCPKCKEKVETDAKFCNKCGEKLEN
ncbi:MAG: zinc ribbon domain-containing protein [Candidatus Hodarchaeota archaeon]